MVPFAHPCPLRAPSVWSPDPPVTGPRSPVFSSARRAPRRQWWRPLGVVLVVLVVVAVLWLTVVGAVWAYAWVRLGGDDIPVLRDDEVAALGVSGARAPDGATTVLVTVTEPLDPTIPRDPALVAPPILAQVGGPRAEPAALVMPLELTVAVEGLGETELAAVQEEGGNDLLVRSIMDHTSVRVDHLVALSIDALPRLVELLGPVEVCGRSGCSTPTPDEVRTLMTTTDDPRSVHALGDVMRTLAAEIDAALVLRSPLTAKRVVDVIADDLVTDASLRGRDLLRLMSALAVPVVIDVDAVPVVRDPSTGELVELFEPSQVRFQHLQEGTRFTPEEDAFDDDEVSLAGISVAVLNGAGVDGLAGDVRTLLETAGFEVVGTGNAPSFGRETTVVSYVEGDAAVALAVAELGEVLGDAQLEPLLERPTFEGDEVDILVTAGMDRTDG
jgi:hypothetical protein